MTYPPPPSDAGGDAPPLLRQHGRQLAAAAALAMQGKINAVVTFTLTANAGSTVLTDPRLTASAAVVLDPMTANAAAALATTYATEANRNKGTWTLTHANTATTDRTFRALLIG